MIYIALCDDDKAHLVEAKRVIEQNAAAHGELVRISVFSSAEPLLFSLQEQAFPIEIAILDIAMQGMDGITLAKRINMLAPQCQIIFLTGYIQCFTEVYNAEHICSVLKEMLHERIWPAIEKAHARYRENLRNYFVVQTAAGLSTFQYSEICYFERSGRKTRIRSAGGEAWCKSALHELMEGGLPKQFMRCHQSFIVNLDHAVAIDANVFTLSDGTRIPISRAYRRESQSQFWNYLNAWVLRQ